MRISVLMPFFVFAAFVLNAEAKAAPSAPVEKQQDVASRDEIKFVPHRAAYDIRLASVKNGSTIADVSGAMTFELADACDGWAIQQNMQMHITHAEGGETVLTSNEVTWESKDGKRYNFNMRHTNDGKETENYRGKANLMVENAKAIYTNPDGKTIDLAAGTLFPTAHTQLIVANAKNGQHFFTRRVFDGSDEEGASDVSAFIGSSKARPVIAVADDKLASSPLMAATEWPVHMAFFKLHDATGEPDYEMDLGLLANGVVRSIKIDYGDFAITGSLKSIEPLSSPHC